MARVVTPWGLDLGEIPDGPLLAYYRAEGYTIDGVAAQVEQLPDGQFAQDDGQLHEAAATGEARQGVEVPQNPDGTLGPATLDSGPDSGPDKTADKSKDK